MELPIYDEIVPCAALKYAFPLSIIMSDQNLYPWVAMNYVYIVGVIKDDQDVSNYHDYIDAYSFATDRYCENEPVLRQQGMSVEQLEPECICSTIKTNLLAGKYVILFVDEYFLPECYLGGKRHFLHEQLIYGFNDTEDAFYGMGMDRQRQYKKITHAQRDIKLAFKKGLQCRNHGNVEWVDENRMICISKMSTTQLYPIDIKEYVEKIRNYIKGRVPEKHIYHFCKMDRKYYFGLDYYMFIKQSVQKENLRDIFKHLNHLYEHKVLQQRGLEAIIEARENLKEESRILLDEWIHLILKRLQYLRTRLLYMVEGGKGFSIEQLMASIQDIQANDERLLSDIIEKLHGG